METYQKKKNPSTFFLFINFIFRFGNEEKCSHCSRSIGLGSGLNRHHCRDCAVAICDGCGTFQCQHRKNGAWYPTCPTHRCRKCKPDNETRKVERRPRNKISIPDTNHLHAPIPRRRAFPEPSQILTDHGFPQIAHTSSEGKVERGYYEVPVPKDGFCALWAFAMIDIAEERIEIPFTFTDYENAKNWLLETYLLQQFNADAQKWEEERDTLASLEISDVYLAKKSPKKLTVFTEEHTHIFPHVEGDTTKNLPHYRIQLLQGHFTPLLSKEDKKKVEKLAKTLVESHLEFESSKTRDSFLANILQNDD